MGQRFAQMDPESVHYIPPACTPVAPPLPPEVVKFSVDCEGRGHMFCITTGGPDWRIGYIMRHPPDAPPFPGIPVQMGSMNETFILQWDGKHFGLNDQPSKREIEGVEGVEGVEDVNGILPPPSAHQAVSKREARVSRQNKERAVYKNAAAIAAPNLFQVVVVLGAVAAFGLSNL